jgi:hypothetical protein
MPRILPSESQASESQIAANRANAQKSTGPRTADGKARSSQNAVKHGLTAKKGPVLPGEDPAEFETFVEALFEDLAPHGATEVLHVEHIATIFWRLRRVPHFEAALMTYVAAEVVSVFHDDPFQDTVQLPALDDAYSIGRMFRVMLSQDQTGKLTRYEASLQKQLSQMLRDFEKLRNERRARTSDSQEWGIVATSDFFADEPANAGGVDAGPTVHLAGDRCEKAGSAVDLDDV